jgi:tetrathionate reductase subunit C
MNMNTTVEILGFTREPGWLPWAVQYFFLIGISAAAFFISLPGLAWRHPEWRGVSRRALLAALVCGLTAPVALLADLHQPGRFLNFYLHPNLQSWMAWGSFFIPLYLFGLLLYAWLCLRPQLAGLAREHEAGTRLAKLYRALAYGGHDNRGAIRVAAVLAALGAVLVLLYTGMEVMVVRARPLWNTPLLPPLFAVTAFAGGLGMTALFEALSGHRDSAPLLNRWAARSQWAVLALLAAWLLSAFTGIAPAAAEALASLRGSVSWRVTLGSLVAVSVLTLWVARKRRDSLVLMALLALLGAWLLRWALIMGGQGIPKMGATFRGYYLTLTPDSALGIVGTAGLFLTLYIVLTSFVPWDESTQAAGAAS